MITIAAGIRSIANQTHRKLISRSHGPAVVMSCGPGFSAERGERGLNQVANVGIAFLIASTQRGSGSIGLFGQPTASQLGIQVAADELKQWVSRILFRKRPGNLKRLFVLLVVVVKAERQVEAGFGRSKNAFVDGAFQLLNAFLFVAAGNAHKEPEHASNAGERVRIIIVKTQA